MKRSLNSNGMNKLKPNQSGFITMIILILVILFAAIAIAYIRVQKAQQ